MQVKSLEDIKMDMSELYESIKKDELELKKASELANVAGKFLKAEQLILAKQIFKSGLRVPQLPDESAAIEGEAVSTPFQRVKRAVGLTAN